MILFYPVVEQIGFARSEGFVGPDVFETCTVCIMRTIDYLGSVAVAFFVGHTNCLVKFS